MDEREDIIEIVKNYHELVKSNFPIPIKNVYIFGSYAKGNPHKDSDIDVAFVVNHFEGDFFEIMPILWKLRRQVDWRIEPHVVARDTDYAYFLNEIQHTGVQIV